MVQDNQLSREASCFNGWVIFAVTSHIATTNMFDRYVLDIEAFLVPRKSLTQSIMVHSYRLNFSFNIDWSKGDHHVGLKNTSLHSAHKFYRCPGEADARACQLDELVTECNPELQAGWFQGHSHLYG
ncbi:unnamed protein product [Gulo gulo]|uniref:Uncharacterized protein n=1 Tax=Gulo gulo TaxID=48420 RepID=A0A9X9LPJ4_GULGU|nr:unnamed protein product [Gulo gulo]